MNPMGALPFVRRLRLRNYKSISKCDVDLGALTLLVGRNGAGKSNFIDSLRFVADSLNSSLEQALMRRGGIDVVRRRCTGHPHNFSIDLELQFSPDECVDYGFEIASQPLGSPRVKAERLAILGSRRQIIAGYQVLAGNVQVMGETQSGTSHVGGSATPLAPVLSDRLYLTFAAGVPEYRRAFDGLRSMVFYHFEPHEMKPFQPSDAGEALVGNGSNIASVLARMRVNRPEAFVRVQEYLHNVVPGLTGVETVQSNGQSALRFSQNVEGSIAAWNFPATLMSDGTLNVLGTLVAINQIGLNANSPRVVGIEEPESALHPAATAALLDAMRESATQTQVLVTTHSPDLLDRVDPETEQLLVLQAKQGTTSIAPVDAASRDTIRNHLYSAGELLRMDQLEPDREDIERQARLPFFAEIEATP